MTSGYSRGPDRRNHGRFQAAAVAVQVRLVAEITTDCRNLILPKSPIQVISAQLWLLRPHQT